MKKNLTLQAAVFLLTMSNTSTVIASPCEPGTYDDGNSCVLTPPGTFTSEYGSVEPIPAPPGTFIPNYGSTDAILAEVGYYSPNQGAIAQTPVSEGFYTVTNGSINQIPAGGIATSITSAIQSENLLTDLAIDLIEVDSSNDLQLAVAYQKVALLQEGIASGRLESSISALGLELDFIRQSSKKFGIIATYSYHHLKNTREINASGNAYQFGLFHEMSFNKIKTLGMLVYGESTTKTQRNITTIASFDAFDLVNSTRIEAEASQGDVTWYGLQSKVNYNFFKSVSRSFSSFIQLGVIAFDAAPIVESGTATFDGDPIYPITGLNVAAKQYISIPVIFGINYDMLSSMPWHIAVPLSLTVGISSNLGGLQKLRLTSQYISTNFDLPVAQSLQTRGLVKLSFADIELAKHLSLSGGIQTQLGQDFMTYGGNVTFVIKF